MREIDEHACMTHIRHVAMAGCCSMAVWACSVMDGAVGASPAIASAAADAADAAGATSRLLRDVMREIGDAACDSDAQCHTVAIGAKPCGGPDAYLAWSNKVSNAGALADLAARYRAAREADNARSGLRSDCAFVPDPGALCLPSQKPHVRDCQLGTRSGSSVR